MLKCILLSTDSFFEILDTSKHVCFFPHGFPLRTVEWGMKFDDKLVISCQPRAVLVKKLLIFHVFCFFTSLKTREIGFQNMINS